MFDLFSGNQLPEGNSSGNTDSSLQAAAQRTNTVGTARPINGFIPANKAQVEGERNNLKRRREQSAAFRQLLAINLQWQEVDAKDTKALTSWRVSTYRNLMRKNLIVARGVSRQEVLSANFADRLKTLQESTKDQVQNRRDRAKERVRR